MPYSGATLYPGVTTYPGSTLVAAFQGSFNGLLFGPGTDVQFTKIDGLRALPALRSGDVVVPRRDGSYPGVNLLGSRIFVVDLMVTVTSQPFETVLSGVANALQNISDPAKQLQLQFLAPGWAGPRQITCRPTKAALPIDLDYSFHKAVIPVEFTAADPLLYDTVLQTASAGLPSPTAGITFPLTFPASFGASTGGSMQVNNAGNYATAPVFTITGPCTNPSLTNSSTGQFMKLNLTLAASDSVVIDMGTRSIMLNGTATRFNAVATGSNWFTLPPGSSTIRVASADSAQVAARFSIGFRSAWGFA
ncbi:hypothetical protein [Cryobacterium sp. GrIS_2_6]|uniref:phage distal tail protein n=1 Tax=Cryobacterium sp. GrIS_2_6 TaxID=3162785 RepID=UPI002E07B738|nr:hypothetical protein [Cryobacterium psychrotolerans]MEC5149219.1 hypothetical protein [Cryobacterium psychrotolerans]MEC5149300.1 hypothetical protein [Cryobacterium psychrotolerans]